MRILLAEDDPKLLKSLIHIFKANKFSVDGVTNGTDTLAYAQLGEYDGLVLDIMMPGLDGIEVLKRLRREGVTAPALFLTARTEVSQRVEGLDAGADDYLAKPFSTAELLARVRAMLRRKDNFVPDLLTYRSLVLNRSTYELSCGDRTQAQTYALQAVESGAERGWISDFRYKVCRADHGSAVVFVNGETNRNTTNLILYSVFLILLGSFAVILLC